MAGVTASVTRDLAPWQRLPLLALGFVALLLGVCTGLARLGWPVHAPAVARALLHGPLMVSGFFGTLISLERAVAIGRRWAYFGPLASVAGTVVLIAGTPGTAGAALISLASLWLLLMSVSVWRRQRALFTATLAIGAGSWLIGNLLWLSGRQVYEAVPWWTGFLVLTIAAERLELSRFLAPPRGAQILFAAIIAALLAGIALGAAQPAAGHVLYALALLALTLWLARHDIARRTVREHGLTRFIAVALLSAYAWLGTGALIALWTGPIYAGPAYDAALHAVFLGFVFSMVFGHAPIILPAVTRFTLRYHPVFYLHLALLHLSLLLRLTGDLAQLDAVRRYGGLLNALALLLFLLNTVTAIVRGRRSATAA